MTPLWRRVLAVVPFDASARPIARHARSLSAQAGARLALAHVVDWGAGLDCDDFSPLTPGETEDRLAVVVTRKLAALAVGIGATDAVPLVGFPSRGGLATLAAGWQPDLAVAGRGFDPALLGGWRCEIAEADVSRLRAWRDAADHLLGALDPRPPLRTR